VSDTLKILDTDFAFIPADKGLNYIICKEFKEVFFDIFEINCGGNKIIAEKVDDLSGDPVLKIATEYDGKLYNSLFVLKEGDDNIVLNVKSLDNGRKVFAKEKEILESVAEEESLPDPETITEETYIVSENAAVDIEKYKADAIRVINENFSNKKYKIEQLQESLTNLIDERLSELKSSSVTDISSLKSDILTKFDEKVNQVEIISDRAVAETNSIRESIEATAELYTNIVITNVDEKTKQLQDLREGVIYDINTKIAELQTELTNQETHVSEAFQSIQTFIDDSKKQLLEQKTTNITDVENICSESKHIVTENLKRAESLISNKINKLQSTADKKINEITTFVESRISVVDNRIADIKGAVDRAESSLQEQISQGLNNILVEAKSHSAILEDKKVEIENIISTTAAELSILGGNIVESVEKKIKDFNLVAIKREDLNSLKKQLETRLENESANLKKYVAGYGGGGSVAQQFAAGGTMNGTLNVTTGQILSGGIDISTLWGGGGGGSADRLINGSYQVILSSNGNLTFPGGEYIGSQYGAPGWFVTPPAAGGIASADGQQYIQINNNQGIFIGTSWPLSAREWQFGRDGNLTFPDNTIQTTAFTNNLSAYTTLNYVDTNFLKLSGGTLTGTVSTNQDIEITDLTKGIILRSPSNLKYRVTVTDAGELVTTLI
jgi:hypothetical protein